MLSAYQYKILRYIRRKGTCSEQRLSRKFGDTVIAELETIPEMVEQQLTSDSAYGCVEIFPDGNYSLTDTGKAALVSRAYENKMRHLDRLLGFALGVLSTVTVYIITEYLLPLVWRSLMR